MADQDNPCVIVVGETVTQLASAITLACGRSQIRAIVESGNVMPEDVGRLSLIETHPKRLVLYWHHQAELPVPLTAEEAAAMAMRWLSLKSTTWMPQPDHDGSNGRGWLVYTGPWGHIGGDHYTICAITPQWLWYGK